MDEKEQADRLAAAEALFMISNRGGKPQLPVRSRPTRRGKKQKVVDYDDITATKKNNDCHRTGIKTNQRPRSGSRSKFNEGVVILNDRGRGRRGGSSGRGRGRGRGKKQVSSNTRRNEYEDEDSDDNAHGLSIVESDRSTSPQSSEREIAKPSRGRGKRRGGKLKEKSHAKGAKAQSKKSVAFDKPPDEKSQGLALVAAAASLAKSDSQATSNESQQAASSGNLPSLGLVSGFKQVSLASRSYSVTEVSALPSLNSALVTEGGLPSMPSLPAELPFLQLSSQPTPNLASLGDVSQSMDVEPSHSGKSEKFLPLKKRKLHKPDESRSTPTTVTADSPVDGMSVSDSEEPYEAMYPEPARPPFTVQAPPIITMHTLMEIKTALQADDDGDLPLHIAVVHENMRMVAKLVSLMRIAGKHVDKFNKQQQTPLHLAIKLDFTEAVELLLKFGADVNAVDCSGTSAIHMAVQGRSTPILRLLLEKCPNAQLNNRNIDGLTPLHTAVDNGDLEQVDLLLSRGADIDVTDGKSGRTPLFRAAESNHKPMVELLLKRGANVDKPSYAGVTVSMAAQGRNLHGVLKLLGSVQDKYGGEAEASSGTSKTSQQSLPPLVYVGFPGSPKPSALPTGVLGMTGQPLATTSSPPPASSSSSSSSPSSSSKHLLLQQEVRRREPGVMYLVRSQSRIGRADNTSGGVMLEKAAESGPVLEETKVFHNVFMVSDDKKSADQLESVSEPASPEGKMEIDESYRKRKGKPGLLSLPDPLDFSGEASPRTRKGEAVIASSSPTISVLEGVDMTGRPKVVAAGDRKTARPTAVIKRVTLDSPKLPGSLRREAVAGNYVGRLSRDGVLHLVPSTTIAAVSSSSPSVVPLYYTPASPSAESKSTPQPSKPQVSVPSLSSSSSIVVPVLSSAASSKPLSPSLSTSLSLASWPSSSSLSASKPVAALAVGRDSAAAPAPAGTVSLTSIQARLYETLLKRSQSIPAGSSPGASPSPQPAPPSSGPAFLSKVFLSPQRLSPASPSSPGVGPPRFAAHVLSEAQLVRGDAPTGTPLIRVPSVFRASRSSSDSNSSSSNTPLNLSKSSEGRPQEESTDASSSQRNPSEPSGRIRVGTGAMTEEQPQASEMPRRKVMSVGMRRISTEERPGSSVSPATSTGASFQTEYEMFLLPDKRLPDGAATATQGQLLTSAQNSSTGAEEPPVQQHSSSKYSTLPINSLAAPASATTDTTTTTTSNGAPVVTGPAPSIVLDPAALAAISKGEIILPSFPHISKCVSPATAFIVRDLLSRQNQLLQKPASSALPSSNGSVPATVSTSSPAPSPGRILVPPKTTQSSSIVGFSGVILSAVPGSALPGNSPGLSGQQEKVRNKPSQQDKSSMKEQHSRKSRRSKEGNKGQRGGQSTATALSSSSSSGPSSLVSPESIPNLSKINSETDQKLKKFLVAKQEGLISAKRKEGEEESGECGDDANSVKPVGIFSGNVQKVKLGRSRAPLSSAPAVNTSAVSSSSSPPPITSDLSPTSSPRFHVLVSPASPPASAARTPRFPLTQNPPTSSGSGLWGSGAVCEAPSQTTDTHSSTPAASAEVSSGETHQANSGSSVVEVSEEDEEEPMEIDCPTTPAEAGGAANRDDDEPAVTTSPATAPLAPAAPAPGLKSTIQIVVHSPTPPPLADSDLQGESSPIRRVESGSQPEVAESAAADEDAAGEVHEIRSEDSGD